MYTYIYVLYMYMCVYVPLFAQHQYENSYYFVAFFPVSNRERRSILPHWLSSSSEWWWYSIEPNSFRESPMYVRLSMLWYSSEKQKKGPQIIHKIYPKTCSKLPPSNSHFIFFHHFHFQSLFDDFSHLIRFAIQKNACLARIRNLFQEWLVIGVRWKLSNCHRVILWRMQLQHIMQTYQTINAIINYCKWCPIVIANDFG